MQPSAQQAFTRAYRAARADGRTADVRSAWRPEAVQRQLFAEAVRRHGSREAASAWVLPPSRSAHVKGYAVDVRPSAFARWLERNGAAYGICRRFDNEWWHFEYLNTTTCPARLPSAQSEAG